VQPLQIAISAGGTTLSMDVKGVPKLPAPDRPVNDDGRVTDGGAGTEESNTRHKKQTERDY
jgi:hypothetical protein